ncbi:MAG: NlpC/P60 family protein [Cyclonatronaceae bacterium]
MFPRPLFPTALLCLALAALIGVSCSSPRTAADPEARLIQQFRKWEGAPYRLGGDSRRGVDCSAFVQIVLRDAYDIAVPRTTREQMQHGRQIPTASASLGDLVFFQTGRTTYHVGILMRGDFFMHASTSRGVTIDRLGEPYWSERLIQMRRINGR